MSRQLLESQLSAPLPQAPELVLVGVSPALMRSVGESLGMSLTVRIGVSTGEIAAGVLARGSLTFAAWGEPVRRALAISALSTSEEILVDMSTLDAASRQWQTEPADDVVDLDGQPITVRPLTARSHTSDATT